MPYASNDGAGAAASGIGSQARHHILQNALAARAALLPHIASFLQAAGPACVTGACQKDIKHAEDNAPHDLSTP